MEFVSPQLIETTLPRPPAGTRMGTYAELRALEPLRTDDFLRLTPGGESEALFNRYVNEGWKVVPVVRRNPDFVARENFPGRVLLEMTSRCNLECVMCPRRSLTRPSIDMPSDLFRRCVDELDAEGINGIWIFNLGESILHPEFESLVAHVSAKKKLGPVWLSSNGVSLSEKFCRIIINSGITYMNLSVNADSAETYRAISPETEWLRQVANVTRFMELKQQSGSRTPFTRVQIIDQEVARGEIDGFLARYAGKADMLAVNTLEGFAQDVDTTRGDALTRGRGEKKKCNRVERGDMFIFSNGETTFCDTDFNGVFSLGNVKDKGIRTLWNSENRLRILQLNRESRLGEVDLCRDCLDYDL